MSPSSPITPLASGTINHDDQVKVELVEPAGMPPMVKATWPPQPTIIDPKRFGDVAATIAQLFACSGAYRPRRVESGEATVNAAQRRAYDLSRRLQAEQQDRQVRIDALSARLDEHFDWFAQRQARQNTRKDQPTTPE